MLHALRAERRFRFARQFGLMSVAFLVSLLLLCTVPTTTFAAQSFAAQAFQGVWNRTDKPIAEGKASRTWLWAPEPFTPGFLEDYADSPNGKRIVQYFDKSRMEINNPLGDRNSQYFVSNGLIAVELISGRLQLGDNKFENRFSAPIGVAGDPDDTTGPTYATLKNVLGGTSNVVGSPVVRSLNRQGVLQDAPGEYGKYNVKYANFEASTSHNIAQPFWDFLNISGPVYPTGSNNLTNGRLFDPVFYATGLPVTEAYWSKVKVGGQVKDVLVQAFERRVLTYTPSNSAAFQVEMGNIGRHYYQWRYGDKKVSSLFMDVNGTTTKAVANIALPNGNYKMQLRYLGKVGGTITITLREMMGTGGLDTVIFLDIPVTPGPIQKTYVGDRVAEFTVTNAGIYTYQLTLSNNSDATIGVQLINKDLNFFEKY
jgi:hypothetical protein